MRAEHTRFWWLVRLMLGSMAALLSLASAGQTLPSRSFSLAEGLPETSVSALTQDGLGRLWLVSEVGAAWYDGHSFHSLTTQSGLPNTRVTALAADPGPARGVWMGLRDGSLCYFNPLSERVQRVTPRVLGSPTDVRAILARDTAARRRVWVGTGGGNLYCLRWPQEPRRRSWPSAPLMQRVSLPLGPDGQPSAINALALGPAGALWVATDQGLLLVDEATGRPRALPNLLPAALATGPVLGLNTAPDGRLWVGTERAGLFVLDAPAVGGQVRQYTTAQGLCSNKVLRIVAEPGQAGRVWVLTGQGLSYLERSTAPVARCLPGTGLVSHSYRRGDLLRDREGNLWATSANGLTQYLPDARFALFGTADGLPGAKVYALAKARGTSGDYWVGTNNGLALLHPGPFPATSCRVLPQREPDTYNIIRAVLERANGDVWAGATKGGTAIWNPRKARWLSLNDQIPELSDATVASLAEDRNGRIWLATESKGLIVYDPVTAHYQQYVGPTLAGARRVMKLLRSHTGTIWLGTENSGLLEAQETAPASPGALPGLRFRAVAPRPAGAEPLSIFSMSEDGRGRLWLSSFGEGLFCYNPVHAAAGLRRVSLQDVPGAHVNNPYFVQCDASGAVWLGTTRGLLRYTPATGRQDFFGSEEGFIGQETGINAVLAEPNGVLWAGTVLGLMRYSPAGAHPNRVPPRPQLTGLRLFMHDTVLRPNARLPHRLNYLTFDYGATSLTTPGRVRYQYRLAGFEPRWNGPSAARSATYTNLPPGEYRFEVRAANEDGLWSPQPAVFAFSVQPPWWRTWWAYLLYAIGLACVMYGVRAYTRDRERERADRQLERQALQHFQELDRVKTDFFTNVSHEFRTPLTLILGPAELLATDPADPAVRRQGGLVLRNARKLLTLINQLLDLSKLEAGALHLFLTPGDVALTVRQLVSSFAVLAKSRQIILACQAPNQPVPLVFDAGKLEEILTNLVANALNFTPAGGRVTVTVIEKPASAATPAGSVSIAVQDTGSGIAAEDVPYLFDRFFQAHNSGSEVRPTGSGIGLALVRELTILHGGTVAVASQPGAGSTFTVELPHGLPAASAHDIPEFIAGATAPGPTQPEPLPVSDGPEFNEPVHVAAEAALVLIIEDNAEVREFIRTTLAPAGYRLLLAATGDAGLALARAEVPDLVVSDVMMPGLDGYQVCAQLKDDVATSHIPVVLLTAKSGPDAKLEGLETGADSFLAKPFNPRELRAQVRNLLALRRQVQAHFAPVPTSITTVAPLASLEPAQAAAHTAVAAGQLSLDQDFLRRVSESMLRHLADESFGIDELGADIGMSRTQIHRKLKALTGQSPGESLRATRLNRALVLLQAQVGTVAEVAYQVGFGSPAAFSTAFSRQFGLPPSAVARHGAAVGEAAAGEEIVIDKMK